MNLIDSVFIGSKQAFEAAGDAVKKCIEQKGREYEVGFPDTAYALPVIYAATGKKVTTLGELESALDIVNSLIVEEDGLEKKALNSGLATAIAAEIIEAVKYATIDNPYPSPCVGHVPDPLIRSLGVPLVQRDIPGIAVVLGECPNSTIAGRIIQNYQAKGVLTFLVGNIINQAIEAEVAMGPSLRVIPIGYDVSSVIHVVSVAMRVPLMFGGLEAGKLDDILQYTAQRVPAFVNVFGPFSELVVAVGAGAIALGFPVLTDQDVTEIPGRLITQEDYDGITQASLDYRGIKLKERKSLFQILMTRQLERKRGN